MQRARRSVVAVLAIQALVALAALAATAGRHEELRRQILDRGDLTETGLTGQELDVVVDVAYVQGLVVFAGLCAVSLLLCWGMSRQRTWAPFWTVATSVAVVAYGITGFAGDLVPGRARPALAGLGITAVTALALLYRLSVREKSLPVAAGAR